MYSTTKLISSQSDVTLSMSTANVHTPVQMYFDYQLLYIVSDFFGAFRNNDYIGMFGYDLCT